MLINASNQKHEKEIIREQSNIKNKALKVEKVYDYQILENKGNKEKKGKNNANRNHKNNQNKAGNKNNNLQKKGEKSDNHEKKEFNNNDNSGNGLEEDNSKEITHENFLSKVEDKETDKTKKDKKSKKIKKETK